MFIPIHQEMKNVQFTLNSVWLHFTVYSVYTVHCNYNVQCIVYIVLCKCTMYFLSQAIDVQYMYRDLFRMRYSEEFKFVETIRFCRVIQI